jgi:hypothetical protein
MVASNSSVAVPDGFRPIEVIAVGDPVLAASRREGKLSWASTPVTFSQGTLGGFPRQMLYIGYGNDFRTLIAEFDVLLMLRDGQLARAKRLIPGADALLDENGDPVPIHSISVGNYLGGEHAIATHFDPAGARDNPDGHLLLINGVIVGDFSLQVGWRGE